MTCCGAADPILSGLSIRDFATICNAICREGKRGRKGFVVKQGGMSHVFNAELMGIALEFEAKRDYYVEGYSLSYRLGGQGWNIVCAGSIYPPGNTERGQGHYYLSAFDQVRFDYLPSRKLRYIFGFRLRGDEDKYRKEAAILRLMLPMWEAA